MKSYPELLEIGMEKANLELTEQERALWRIRVLSAEGVETVEDLKQRISEFVHVTSWDGTPCKLSSLNRRFGKASAKLGLSIRAVTEQLVGEDRLAAFEGRGSMLYYSPNILKEQQGHNPTVITSLRMNGV